MHIHVRFLVSGIGLLVCLATTGCGGNSDLARVEGQVTLDGEPLPDALVVFAPTSQGTTSYGRTDQDGRYELFFSDREKGAYIGENRVEISTGDVDPTMSGPGKPELVPSVYNERSTVTVEVTSGTNVHNFDLESDAGRVIQPIAE